MSEAPDIRQDNLLSQIWLKPRRTLEFILLYYPDRYVSGLLVLGGIVRSLDRAEAKGMGDQMGTLGVLLLAGITGALFGWITYYVYGWGLSATGRWLRGTASADTLRTVLAWALVPSVASLLLLPLRVLIFGDDLFRSQPLDESAFATAMGLVFGVLNGVLGVWTLVILVKGITLVQGFPTGKAVLSAFLPGLLLLGAVVVAILLFKALSLVGGA